MFWVSGRITLCIVGTGASPFRVFCWCASGSLAPLQPQAWEG